LRMRRISAHGHGNEDILSLLEEFSEY